MEYLLVCSRRCLYGACLCFIILIPSCVLRVSFYDLHLLRRSVRLQFRLLYLLHLKHSIYRARVTKVLVSRGRCFAYFSEALDDCTGPDTVLSLSRAHIAGVATSLSAVYFEVGYHGTLVFRYVCEFDRHPRFFGYILSAT